MSKTPPVIGIDGGGTKTLAWLAPLDDATNTIVLGRGQSGPGNPRAAGFDIAQNNIATAIEAAFAAAKLPQALVAAACFGLAGAGREVEQQRISQWAVARGIAHQVRVCGDAEPILAAASSDNSGIALICGTGSLAWGRNTAGKIARSGGWGYLLGDEGSGYWIARAGLVAAMRAADGRGALTSLLLRFQQELQANSPQELIERVYSPQMTRERIASLAHLVFDNAERDETARQIIADAALELAAMVAAVRRELQLPANDYSLALAGGIITNEPCLQDLLIKGLHDGPPNRVVSVAEPVRGAVAIARQLAVS